MKEFAGGITDSEARKKVVVSAFWKHIKKAEIANKEVKVIMGKASPWSIEELDKRFPTGIIKSKATYQSQLAGLVTAENVGLLAEKVGLLEDRMCAQEDLSAEQKLISNDMFSKLNQLQSTGPTRVSDKPPSDKLPVKPVEESNPEVRDKP